MAPPFEQTARGLAGFRILLRIKISGKVIEYSGDLAAGFRFKQTGMPKQAGPHQLVRSLNSSGNSTRLIKLAASKRFYLEKLGFAEDFSVDGWAFLSRGA